MDLKHLKTKNQKAAAKHKAETDSLQVGKAHTVPAQAGSHTVRCLLGCLCMHVWLAVV